MSNDIYSTVVDIYESADDFRTQTDSNTNRSQALQSTGSECEKNRSYRSASVFLLLLCVLLLTAVIVLCVLINTNNHQFPIKSKNITEERDELQAKYNDIMKLNQVLNQKKNPLRKLLCDGWIYYQSSFYFISSEKKNWTESRRYCTEREADLIIINNREENEFVRNFSGYSYGYGVWIGLSDSDVEGRWKWVDNSTLTSSFWRSGEPNSQGDEDCVESLSSGWNDESCNVGRKWICERNVFK